MVEKGGQLLVEWGLEHAQGPSAAVPPYRWPLFSRVWPSAKRAVVHLSTLAGEKKEILCWASATRVKRITLSESSLGSAMLHKYVLEYFPHG